MNGKMLSLNNNNNHENLNREIIFDEQEENEFLLKIIEKNFEKIELSSKIMKYSEIISLFSFLVFLIILCFKLSPKGSFNWLFINIPGIITIIGIIIFLNSFFYIKDLIDKTENSNNGSIKTGNFFSIIASNIIGFSLLIFLILITLRLNNNIKSEIDLNLIFIPLYIVLFTLLLYGIFISPAFMSNKLYIEILLIFIYVLSGFIFSCLLCVKVNNINRLDYKNKVKYFHCFLPFYFTFGANLIYLIFNFISDLKNFQVKSIFYLTYVFGFIFLIIGTLMTQLKQDNIMKNKNYYIEIILLIISFILFSFNKIIDLFKYEEIE